MTSQHVSLIIVVFRNFFNRVGHESIGIKISIVMIKKRCFYFSITNKHTSQRVHINSFKNFTKYLGREWYNDGKMMNKKNSFFDFIDCSKYLIENKYTSAKHLYAMGGSAGGLLMGGISNFNPELYNGIIAAVPFVDVISTMLDESIPLTTGEFDEWGNPKEKEAYDYMLSYSPYDQVQAKDYPNMLVTTGYFDSQVQYWEPAKWVAKLREVKTDNNILLLRTNMDVGHGGASGRFDSLKETARDYTFLLALENKL